MFAGGFNGGGYAPAFPGLFNQGSMNRRGMMVRIENTSGSVIECWAGSVATNFLGRGAECSMDDTLGKMAQQFISNMPCNQASCEDVCQWLKSHNLAEYVDFFRESDIDGYCIPDLLKRKEAFTAQLAEHDKKLAKWGRCSKLFHSLKELQQSDFVFFVMLDFGRGDLQRYLNVWSAKSPVSPGQDGFSVPTLESSFQDWLSMQGQVVASVTVGTGFESDVCNRAYELRYARVEKVVLDVTNHICHAGGTFSGVSNSGPMLIFRAKQAFQHNLLLPSTQPIPRENPSATGFSVPGEQGNVTGFGTQSSFYNAEVVLCRGETVQLSSPAQPILPPPHSRRIPWDCFNPSPWTRLTHVIYPHNVRRAIFELMLIRKFTQHPLRRFDLNLLRVLIEHMVPGFCAHPMLVFPDGVFSLQAMQAKNAEIRLRKKYQHLHGDEDAPEEFAAVEFEGYIPGGEFVKVNGNTYALGDQQITFGAP